MQAGKRFSEAAIETLRAEIQSAGGNEIFVLGFLDDSGLVCRVRVAARGNAASVPALIGFLETPEGEDPGGAGPLDEVSVESRVPDVFIHNHPSGFLTPSDNDLVLSSRAAESGAGSFIVDNEVSQVYVVAEPARRRRVKKLDRDKICAALEPGGAVAGRLPSFELRSSQLELMELIIRAFNEDALAAAEAGTGVGKSFAYLLPAMRYALDNGERILISTATITLQQQLFDKDIPLVAAALGGKIKAALVKGRGNYLCWRRLDDALREAQFLDEDENEALGRIAQWAESVKSGSRSDLSFMPPETVWSRVCSEADLCMGMGCPNRERCFVMTLRRECADARILVVNHHLLFADLAARREGAGYEATVVLPPYRRLIIDEAHTMESAATSFFSREWSRLSLYRQLGRLLRKRRARRFGLLLRLADLTQEGRGEAFIDKAQDAVERIRAVADELDERALELCQSEGCFRLSPQRAEAVKALLIPGLEDLRRELLVLINLVREALEDLKDDDADDPAVWELKGVLRRLDTISEVCASFMGYREHPGEVMWLERFGGGAPGSSPWARFTVTPLDTAPALADALFRPNKTVVCVSATLTVNSVPKEYAPSERAPFAYWMGRSGLALVEDRPVLCGQFPSPFPYKTATLLAVPGDAPLPEESAFRPFVDQAVTRLAETAGGSALILFTSYEALKSAYAAARPVLEQSGIRCFKQGDDDRSRLLASFLADETSVLFATDSFWEGVDAPGDTLRLVILCRLPFRSPNDPVFEARSEALDKQGGNPFMDLSLPEAVMKFKQGFGRLMRRSSDRGVVAVLDGRLLRKRYGEVFLRSIPPSRTCFAEFDTILRETERFLFSMSHPVEPF